MFAEKIPILSMLLHAGMFARIILLILIAFSVISWMIVLGKQLSLSSVKRKNNKFLRKFISVGKLGEWIKNPSSKSTCSVETLALVIGQEYKDILSKSSENQTGSDRVLYLNTQFSILQSIMEQSVAREVAIADKGLVFLAISASVSPFLGLLGTVWGITHSFYDIGRMGSTSINIVAPGIAEALVTTIFGLVVAIPCAIFYNVFTKKIQEYEGSLIDFSMSLLADAKNLLLKL